MRTLLSAVFQTLFFTLVLETVLTWRAVQFECGKPLLLVDCYVPYQHCALVSNRLKYICTFFVWTPTSE